MDNDIVKKLSVYDLFGFLNELVREAECGLLVLGSAPFVLRKAILKSRSLSDVRAAAVRLSEALALCASIEPDDQEAALAAQLEDFAQEAGVPFDEGESLLVAILATRVEHALITGDKRALAALPTLASNVGVAERLTAKIACLEQTIATALKRLPDGEVQRHVCREPAADKAISICLGCLSGPVEAAGALEALSSYVNSVRNNSSPLLSDGDDLSVLLF